MSIDKNNRPYTSQYLAAEDAAIAMMESAARTERHKEQRKNIKNHSLVEKLAHALKTKTSGR